MSEMLTSEEFRKRLESFKQRVINTWDYSNRDSYNFPRLPQLEADEAVRRNELIAHDAFQRQRIAQLEEQRKVAEHIEGSFWAALKLLNLTELDVQNPGRHFTDRIAQLEADVARLRTVQLDETDLARVD
jgi:hypothetical protein